VPQIYTLTSDSIACLINGYGSFVSAVKIGVGIKTDTSGSFGIFPSLIDNFDAASIIQLEDRVTGIFHDLRGNHYNFSVTQGQLITGRFVLHVSYPPIISTVDADCNDAGGSVEIVQDSSIAWTLCRLYDSLGVLMGSYANINGNFAFNYLHEGNYTLSFVYNDYTVYKSVYVKGHRVDVNITASAYTAAVGQLIQFFSFVSNATYYMWSFGDGTIITGITNPEVGYYEPGTYMVILNGSNIYGCKSADTITVTIVAATGITPPPKQEVTITAVPQGIILQNMVEGNAYQWQVTNLLGSVVATGTTYGSTETIMLGNQPTGVYLVTLSSLQGRLTKKILLHP
jgi:PKD repeat protein